MTQLTKSTHQKPKEGQIVHIRNERGDLIKHKYREGMLDGEFEWLEIEPPTPKYEVGDMVNADGIWGLIKETRFDRHIYRYDGVCLNGVCLPIDPNSITAHIPRACVLELLEAEISERKPASEKTYIHTMEVDGGFTVQWFAKKPIFLQYSKADFKALTDEAKENLLDFVNLPQEVEHIETLKDSPKCLTVSACYSGRHRWIVVGKLEDNDPVNYYSNGSLSMPQDERLLKFMHGTPLFKAPHYK